jgi:hypothetical protein
LLCNGVTVHVYQLSPGVGEITGSARCLPVPRPAGRSFGQLTFEQPGDGGRNIDQLHVRHPTSTRRAQPTTLEANACDDGDTESSLLGLGL